MSAPFRQSINNYIDKELFTLRYRSINDAIAVCNVLGPGTLLAKIDLKDAFRICLVRLEDRDLLGIHWEGKYYFDKCPLFSLRSAPYLFNQVAEAIEWILRNNHRVGTPAPLFRLLPNGWPSSSRWLCRQHTEDDKMFATTLEYL